MVLANIAIACGLLFVWFEFVLKPLLEWGRHAGSTRKVLLYELGAVDG
jgi:hypothetical protein